MSPVFRPEPRPCPASLAPRQIAPIVHGESDITVASHSYTYFMDRNILYQATNHGDHDDHKNEEAYEVKIQWSSMISR